jgi:hypothetical protein
VDWECCTLTVRIGRREEENLFKSTATSRFITALFCDELFSPSFIGNVNIFSNCRGPTPSKLSTSIGKFHGGDNRAASRADFQLQKIK